MAEQRLPIVDGDDGAWGDILNQFLEKEHYNTGVDNTANGGHKNITLRPGTTTAGTAPLKFTSGSLLSSPEVGAIEFLNDRFYYTQTTGTIRRAVAAADEITHTPSAVWGDCVLSTSISTGTKCYVRLPYSGTIVSWSIVASTSCSCTIDVWKANNAVPTVSNTITASAKPALSSTATTSSSTLTGWTTSVAVGDVLGFNLDALSGGSPTSLVLTLSVVNG